MDASMSISGNVDNAGMTQFANEACDAVTALGNYVPASLTTSQANVQDIKEYFARPRLYSRGVVTFGTTAQLHSYQFNSDQGALKAIFPQWEQRLAGAYGIRFTMNFRLQVAATAFHQGVVVLCWQYNKTSSSTSLFPRTDHAPTCTNIPHVRLDLSEQTMVELSVPFIYPTEFMEVEQIASTQYAFPYGQVSLVPILPSASVAGLSAATYDLYCYLTDIELLGVDVINPTVAVLQSGGDILTREIKSSGVVSSSLANMSKISRFLARGVPSLSAIAGPAAWALDTMAGVAKYFGYSKPMLQDPAAKMLTTRYAADGHVDQPATGEVVGLFQGNSTVVSTSLGATDVDEMSLAFITQQWSQICRLSVATTDTHGVFIYTSPVSPSVMWFRAGSTRPFSNISFPKSNLDLVSQSGNSFIPSSLMYISSFFRLWRGSIRYRFTFSKTKLHGGRYMVTFNPYASYQGSVANFGAQVLGPETVATYVQPYGNSLIMDLKDGNVFEFQVPYTSMSPYVNFTSAIGSIAITCVDPLQATATVSASVGLLVEVCGSSDFELADYAGPYFPLHKTGTIYTQSGGSVVIPVIADPAPTTIGEVVKSVKQLIQVPHNVRIPATAGTVSENYVAPWFVYTAYQTINALSGLPNTNNSVGAFRGAASPGAALAQCYAFCKGGTDLHVYTQQNTVQLRIHQVPQEYEAPSGSLRVTTLSKRCFPSASPMVIASNGTAMHARLPSFQAYARIPVCYLDTNISGPMPTSITGAPKPVVTHFNKLYIDASDVANNEDVFINRSASDDAALAHYMGPVPIFIPNGLSTNPIEPEIGY
jgi:hypothetical protein